MKLIARLTLYCLLLLPLTAGAELPPQLNADFAPLDGRIIMPIGDEYLVDLDASVNLEEGDILTLVMPGEKVIHPVTKEILGSIDIPTGYLRVTRIKSGYSYAKLLYAEAAPEKGDQIRRFEQVPAAFVDDQQSNSRLAKQLRSDLSQLNWQTSESTTEPLLLFDIGNSQLQVKSATGNILHSYPIVAGAVIAPTVAKPISPLAIEPEPKLLQKTVNEIMGVFGVDKDKRDPTLGIIRRNENEKAGIWLSQHISGDAVGITVADFNDDGVQETAFATDKQLIIATIIQGKFTQNAEFSVPAGVQILSLEAIDLDKNGRKEIYLTVVSNGELASRGYEYVAGSYQQTVDKASWFLRAMELPGEGTVLLGQRLGDQAKPFAGQPFRIIRNGSKLTEGEPLPLPGHVNLYSFTTLKGTEGQRLFVYLSASDYLKVVDADGTEIWESSDYYGGSEARFDHHKTMTKTVTGGPYLPVYIRSRLLKTTTGEILVAQNDGLRTLERYRKFKSSRLIALNWNGLSMTESWRTSNQSGYLGDFTIGDADNDGADEIAMFIKFKHKGVLSKARSAIVTYELN